MKARSSKPEAGAQTKHNESKRNTNSGLGSKEILEAGQFKPKNEGINNTDVPGVPRSKRALNNPTGQDENLSGGGTDPLADL